MKGKGRGVAIYKAGERERDGVDDRVFDGNSLLLDENNNESDSPLARKDKLKPSLPHGRHVPRRSMLWRVVLPDLP